MNKKIKNGLVPELRFPEFINDGNWKEKTLSQVADYENGKAHEQDIDKNGDFLVVNSKFVSTEGKVKKFSNTASCLAKKDDILMVLSDVPNGRAIAKCFLVDKDNFYTVNQRICRITATEVVSKLLFYLINRSNYFLSFDDGAKQTNLRNDDVLKCPLLLPLESKEQQKIADCLASLDNIIEAQNQKIGLLKSHKKGIMQQFFPVNETIPKLRFKEFKNDVWTEKSLNKITSTIFDGTHQTPSYTDEGIPFFSVENIVSGNKNKFISKEDHIIATSKNKPEKGDILITRIGNIGYSTIVNWDYEFSIYVTLAVIKKSSLFHSYYLHSYFQTERYQSEIRSKSLLNATPCKINMDELRKTEILLPQNMKEQQKIAECFLSLDNQIEAEKNRLEVLKRHKKGLMQQLFPTNKV